MSFIKPTLFAVLRCVVFAGEIPFGRLLSPAKPLSSAGNLVALGRCALEFFTGIAARKAI